MPRLIAIVFIYACTAGSWAILGSTVFYRSAHQDRRLRHAVGELWGTEQHQAAPSFWYETTQRVERTSARAPAGDGTTAVEKEIVTETVTHPLPVRSSRIGVDLKLDQRKKGLLWYSTYKVAFDGVYTVTNDDAVARDVIVSFPFPSDGAVYDDFRMSLGGRTVENVRVSRGAVRESIRLEPGAGAEIAVGYRSQGLDRWSYGFGGDVSQVRDFRLAMTTDFARVDFPEETISPTSKRELPGGMLLTWEYANLLTGVRIGMELPHRLNPGPWVGQVTMAAPVSLFLFFFLLFMFTTLCGVRLHPMHYFFIAAGFFSFHLLMAYLVDHAPLPASFAIASAVSVALVVSYMRMVVGRRTAFVEIAASQLVYLVLFSCTFFFEGFTGLAIAVLCVATLFVVMQFTGRVNWDEVFSADRKPLPPGRKN